MAYPTSSSRTTYVGTDNIGDVVQKTNLDLCPGGMAAYAQLTANSPGQTAGFASVAGLAVLCPGTVGRFYKITIGAAGFGLSGTGTVTCDWCIYDNSALVGLTSTIACNAQSVAFNSPGQRCVAYQQPGASHQYIAAMNVVANSGAPAVSTLGATSNSAARTSYILCQDAGATF